MVDMIFSFGELGFQEIETSNYLIGILEQNGFKDYPWNIRYPYSLDGRMG